MKYLCILHVAEGGLDNLRCPQLECKKPFMCQLQHPSCASCSILSFSIRPTFLCPANSNTSNVPLHHHCLSMQYKVGGTCKQSYMYLSIRLPRQQCLDVMCGASVCKEYCTFSMMGPAFVQNLAGLLAEEQLARWEDLELAQGLQRMTDCVFCPRCSSACLEDAENCAQCPKCFFVFCSLCNESWHPVHRGARPAMIPWPALMQCFECCPTT